MTVLLVLASLLLLLVLACLRESRSGRPAWGAHLERNAASTRSAATAAKKSAATTAALGAAIGIDGADG